MPGFASLSTAYKCSAKVRTHHKRLFVHALREKIGKIGNSRGVEKSRQRSKKNTVCWKSGGKRKKTSACCIGKPRSNKKVRS